MRTNVPMPVNSSSPASVVPGVKPLAAQAAASQSSWAAMVSAMTCCRRSARAAASVSAHEPAWSATLVDDRVQRSRVERCRREDAGAVARRGLITGRGHCPPARDGHVTLLFTPRVRHPREQVGRSGRRQRTEQPAGPTGAPGRAARVRGRPWSGDSWEHFLGQQLDVLEVVEVEHLEIDRTRRRCRRTACSRATTSSGVPATPLARSSSALRPMLAARRSTSASLAPQQTVWAADSRSVPGSRPLSLQAARTRANWASVSASDEKGRLNSSAKVAARRGVRLGRRPRR